MNLNAITLAITRPGGVRAARPWDPLYLFLDPSTQGAWYDPSDFTTLFQDAAGTTPVTAVEQPVGKMLDKSGNGNHAFNNSGNSANFPVLSARYNLLTKTEDFSDAVWFKASSQTPSVAAPTFTTYTGVDPKGNTSTIYRFTFPNVPTSGGLSILYQITSIAQQASLQYRNLVYIKRVSGGTQIPISVESSTTAPTSGGYSTSILTVTDSWAQYSATSALSGTPSGNLTTIIGPDGRIASHLNLGAITVDIWGADLRVANDALNQPAYQRVNTATDYDTVGFKPYLRFNGTNQWLQTNSIDFRYTDKMFVSAGVRKLSDAAYGTITELSIGNQTGQFAVFAPGSSANYQFFLCGVSINYAIYEPASTAPITQIASSSFNFGGTTLSTKVIPRLNGVFAQTNGSMVGDPTGNFGNYPLYIGARAGTSLYFNGRLYQMVVAGKQASADEITNTETFINQKTGAY